MVRRIVTTAVFFAALFVLLVAESRSQPTSGTLAGRVVDAQAAALRDAAVTAIGRQGLTTARTDENGAFRFAGLSAGLYDITVELAGFRSSTHRGVRVGLGQTTTTAVVLEVGGPSEVVDVVAPLPVDRTAAGTSVSLTPQLLFNVPINVGPFNTAVGILDFAPGVNRGSAFGSDANFSAALLVDGVDTRDPDAGGTWVLYNYNLVEEMEFTGLGARAELGGFTGLAANTITKSGGNRHAALFELRHTNDGWAGENLTAEQRQLNPTLGESSVLERLVDYTTQIGGPLAKDRLFYWGGVQRYSLTMSPAGPISTQTEVSPRFNGKLTLRRTAGDTLVASAQWDRYNVTGLPGFPQTLSTDAQTLRQASPGLFTGIQYRRPIGTATLLDARFGGFVGSFYLDPVDRRPVRLDAVTGGATGGGGLSVYNDRRRAQLNVSLSHARRGAGLHDFKVGLELERSRARNRQSLSDHLYYLDFSGAPYLAFNGPEYDLEGQNARSSFYGQDAWQLRRLALDLGVRLDVIRGRSPRASRTVYAPALAVGPRLGVAFDFTDRGSAVVKASFGRFFEGAAVNPYSRALPGFEDLVSYDVLPNGRLVEFDRVPQLVYGVDDDIRHFGFTEKTVSWQQQLLGMRLVATGIWRDYTNFTVSVLPQARWSPLPMTNPLTGRPLTLYRWANRSQSDRTYTITNASAFRYRNPAGESIGDLNLERTYRGLMVVATRPLRAGAQAQVSYVWSQSRGNVGNRAREGFGGTSYENPNTGLVNVSGAMENDRTHELKALASVELPWRFSSGVAFRAVSGRTYTPVGFIAGTTVNTVNAITVNLEPRGQRRYETEYQVDLRVEKRFMPLRHRVGVFVDVQNLLNANTVLSVQTRFPFRSVGSAIVPFEAPVAVTGARQATVGARWSF